MRTVRRATGGDRAALDARACNRRDVRLADSIPPGCRRRTTGPARMRADVGERRSSANKSGTCCTNRDSGRATLT